MFGLTANDAKYLLAGFGVLIPFVISWLPTLKISDYVKFGILVALSVAGGFLTIVSTDQLVSGGSLIQNGAVILTAAQVFYYAAFRVLGLERVLFPQQAVETEVKEQAKTSAPTITTAKAKEVLNPTTPSSVSVETTIS